MYLVIIQTGDKKIAINELSTKSFNRIMGQINQGINTIDSFEFTIYPNNDGYNEIYPYRTTVQVYNTKTDEYDFRGRVIMQTDEMGTDGLVSKTFLCESELGYLCDSVQLYGEFHEITVASFLEYLLTQHNSLVEESKQFTAGTVENLDNNDSLYRYLSYNTTWNNLKSDLIDKLGGELQIRYENGVRYLDYLHQIGSTSSTEIVLGRNMRQLTEEKDATEYCTRLLPLGGKLTKLDDRGQEVETEQRMTVADVNNGSIYVEDTSAIKEFGEKTAIKIWDDVSNPDNLLRKAQEYLVGQKITISDSITAVDLSLLDMDIDTFRVGDVYTIKNPLLGIQRDVRIISKSISIESPQDTSISLGEPKEGLLEHNLSDKKQIMAEVEKTIKRQSSFEQSVEGFKLEVTKTLEGQIDQIAQLELTAEQLDSKITDNVNDLQSQITQNANEITTKVSSGDVGTIVTQNATSWGLSINGKLSGTNYTFDGSDFTIGKSNGDTTAYHAPSYSKWTHSDGSYSQADSNGFKRYSNGTGKSYFYFNYVGEAIMESWDEVTIPLPEDISGKVGTNYSVLVAIRSYTFGDDWANIATQQLCVYVESKTSTSFILKTFKTGLNVVDYSQKIDGTMAIQYTIIA